MASTTVHGVQAPFSVLTIELCYPLQWCCSGNFWLKKLSDAEQVSADVIVLAKLKRLLCRCFARIALAARDHVYVSQHNFLYLGPRRGYWNGLGPLNLTCASHTKCSRPKELGTVDGTYISEEFSGELYSKSCLVGVKGILLIPLPMRVSSSSMRDIYKPTTYRPSSLQVASIKKSNQAVLRLVARTTPATIAYTSPRKRKAERTRVRSAAIGISPSSFAEPEAVYTPAGG